MKRTYFIAVLLLLFETTLYGQRSADIGIALGADNFFGDLGNEKLFPISNTHMGIAVTARNFLNSPEKSHTLYKPLSMEARLSWQRIGYEEADAIGSKSGFELHNYGRGLGFRNDVFGASLHATYTFYQNKYKLLNKQGICFYLLAGVGVYYGKPKADLFLGSINLKNRYYFWNDGTIRDADQGSGRGNIIQRDGIYETNLQDWMTEGEGTSGENGKVKRYSYTNIGFPMGIGVRKGITREITLSLEVDYYYFLSDYLDDVSNRYATFAEIQAAFPNDPVKQALAKYISDPTGYGTDGTNGPATSRRGNPKKYDAYSYISLEFAYKFILKQKSYYGQY